jgi:hypothetical protein
MLKLLDDTFDLFHAVDVGEAAVDAVVRKVSLGEPGVIDAQEVQHGGVDVVDGRWGFPVGGL